MANKRAQHQCSLLYVGAGFVSAVDVVSYWTWSSPYRVEEPQLSLAGSLGTCAGSEQL